MEISLTDFVEFTLKTGSARLTKIKQIKERPDYHPNFDYWKILRDKIIELHQNDNFDSKELHEVTQKLNNKAKEKNYENAIDCYCLFLKKKSIKWFNPPYSLWQNNELVVRINPELGLIIDNVHYIIKLYFGGEKISKSKIDLVLSLMSTQLDSDTPNNHYNVAILDVKSKKLHIGNNSSKNKLLPLIIGESTAFINIWNNI